MATTTPSCGFLDFPPITSAKSDIYVTWQMDVDTSANEVETGPFVLSSVRVSTLTGHSCPLEARLNGPDSLVSLYLLHFVMAGFWKLTFG